MNHDISGGGFAVYTEGTFPAMNGNIKVKKFDSHSSNLHCGFDSGLEAIDK